MKRKILTLLLIFCLTFNLVLLHQGVSHGEGENTVRVRIEGKNNTLFDKEVTVTDEVYGYDLLVNTLGEYNIDSTYYESFDSYLINGLLGEGGESGEDYSTGWMYYAKNGNEIIEPMVGINNFNIQNIDELVFYISASDSSWNPLTSIPTVSVSSTDNQYQLTVEQSGSPVEGAVVDASLIGNFITDVNGQAAFEIGKGIYDVVISKGSSYPEIVRQHVTLEGEYSPLIKGAVADLKEYYKRDGKYSFREALALNQTSNNVSELKDINLRLEINEGQSASAYAGNIMGLIAAGKDPENYDGTNFVQLLTDSQVTDEGESKGKFIVSQYDDYPTTVAYCILALDMARAQYNVGDAVNALINYANDGNFGTVDDTAMAIMALANHKDIAGVPELINSAINYLKSQQLDSGGFEAWGAENPYSIATVIQALVANNIDPLGAEWTKDGNTMLDALLQFKADDHFVYTSQWGTDINMATEQAFTALADLYKGRSMYQNVKEFKITAEEDFTVTRVGTGSFGKGSEAALEVNVKNNTDFSRQVTLIVALYDTSENRMVNYVYMTKTLEPGKSENITGGFLIPESGNYEVRGFLWDNMQNMNVLADPITVEVN